MDGAKSASAHGCALARPLAEVILPYFYKLGAQRPEGLSSGAGRFSLVFAPFQKVTRSAGDWLRNTAMDGLPEQQASATSQSTKLPNNVKLA